MSSMKVNTLRSREKNAAISQTTFSKAFSWMKVHEFGLRFHWSLLIGIELTIITNPFNFRISLKLKMWMFDNYLAMWSVILLILYSELCSQLQIFILSDILHTKHRFKISSSGTILCMGSANERRRYIVTSTLIGWAHAKGFSRLSWKEKRTFIEFVSQERGYVLQQPLQLNLLVMEAFIHGPLAGYVKLGVRMHWECREHFPHHHGLAIPTCIMARVWRTHRDAYRDR